MSQKDFGNLSSPLSGGDFIDGELEPWRDAVHSNHSGTTPPSYVVAGMCWLDTASTPWVMKAFDGTDHIPWVQFNASTNKVSYVGASIGPTAARQHTLPDVASDTVTLNAASQTLSNKTVAAPNITGAVAIDGTAINAGVKASWTLTAAADKVSYFTGSGAAALTDFTSFGRAFVGAADADAAKVLLGDTGISGNDIDALDAGTVTATHTLPARNPSTGAAEEVTAQSIADLAATEIPTDYGAVGTYMMVACSIPEPNTLSLGSTIAGSSLRPALGRLDVSSGSVGVADVEINTSALSGTWRFMGLPPSNNSVFKQMMLAVRIS